MKKSPVQILGSQFLTDGVKTVMVREVGSQSMLPWERCSVPAEKKPDDSCLVNDSLLEDLFSKIEYVLLMTSQGIVISGTGSNILAEYNKIAALEQQVTLERLRLATKVDKNKCEIKLLEFGGWLLQI